MVMLFSTYFVLNNFLNMTMLYIMINCCGYGSCIQVINSHSLPNETHSVTTVVEGSTRTRAFL